MSTRQIRGRVMAVTFNVADLARARRFWSAVTGRAERASGNGWTELEPLAPDGPRLALREVPAALAGGGHLDLEVPDLDRAAAVLWFLGAEPVDDGWSPGDGPGRRWQTWRDPDGHIVCLVAA